MLARYKIYRGRRPDGEPLPEGVRQDTRLHTRHVTRPTWEIVQAYLSAPSDAAWETFRREYLALVERRYQNDPRPFDRLATLATQGDLYLGCTCPTRKNPTPRRCHTYLALQFLAAKYPNLEVHSDG